VIDSQRQVLIADLQILAPQGVDADGNSGFLNVFCLQAVAAPSTETGRNSGVKGVAGIPFSA
jgi:hypothetical protein